MTIEHPAVSRRRGGSGGLTLGVLFSRSDPVAFSSAGLRRQSNQCRACRASSMCRLANLFAAAHTFETAPRSFAAKSVKTSPLTDPARLPSRSAFLRRSSCDALRARRGTWSHRASLLGLRWFCRQRAGHYAPSSERSRAACANAVVLARPPFTSAYRMDAGVSLGQT